jgi:hypothetical protein
MFSGSGVFRLQTRQEDKISLHTSASPQEAEWVKECIGILDTDYT